MSRHRRNSSQSDDVADDGSTSSSWFSKDLLQGLAIAAGVIIAGSLITAGIPEHFETARKAKVEVAKQEAEVQQREERLLRGTITPLNISGAQYHQRRRKLRSLPGYYHIGVCGQGGTGKSSIVNALRKLKNSEPEAARVGNIGSLRAQRKYIVPSSHMILYDTPGVRTSPVGTSDYFISESLYAMDLVVVVSGNRVRYSDIEILVYCAELNIPYLLVRSRADSDIRSSENNEALPPEAQAKRLSNQRNRVYSQAHNEVAKVFASKGLSLPTSKWFFIIDAPSLYRYLTSDGDVSPILDEVDFMQAVNAQRPRLSITG